VNRHHKERDEVWAVVRYDEFQSDPEVAFTIKEIVRSRELADMEAARLNELNSEKQCRYWVLMGRLFPEDSAAGPTAR